MRVLMGVDMGQVQSAALQESDLGEGFGLNFSTERTIGCGLDRVQSSQEGAESGLEAPYVSDRVDKPEQVAAGSQDRFAIDKNDVTSDAEPRIGKCNCFFRRGCPGHESGAGQRAAMIELDNRAVDSGSEAEVVGVYNQSLHLPSVSSRVYPAERIQPPSMETRHFWLQANR